MPDRSLLTDRLILRDLTDADLLFDLDSDPEVMRYVGPRPAPDVAGCRDRTRTVDVPFQAHPAHFALSQANL
jgi:RimJ/RimL family protein N-acetyltransferase